MPDSSSTGKWAPAVSGSSRSSTENGPKPEGREAGSHRLYSTGTHGHARALERRFLVLKVASYVMTTPGWLAATKNSLPTAAKGTCSKRSRSEERRVGKE